MVVGGLAFPVRTSAVEEPFCGAFDFDFGSGMGAGTIEAYSDITRAARAFLVAPPSNSSFNAPASNWALDRFLFSSKSESRDGGSEASAEAIDLTAVAAIGKVEGAVNGLLKLPCEAGCWFAIFWRCCLVKLVSSESMFIYTTPSLNVCHDMKTLNCRILRKTVIESLYQRPFNRHWYVSKLINE